MYYLGASYPNKFDEGGQSIGLPGGRGEAYESLNEALKREVWEETGLTITHIEGSGTRVKAKTEDTEVECVRPFAVYQTVKGPVDSIGVYFLCRAEGNLLDEGHETLNPQWMPVDQIVTWMEQDDGHIVRIDWAGLLFYLKGNGFLA